MEEDKSEKQDYVLELASKVFLYKTTSIEGVDRTALKEEILRTLQADDLTALYEYVCEDLGWAVDDAKLLSMRAANAATLQALEEKIKDAEENLGETEVRDAVHAKADFFARIGDKAAAVEAYEDTEGRTASAGSKIDLLFSQIRLFILYGEWHTVKALLEKAKLLGEEGGDWEHKNKLKVYEAVFRMYLRDFKRAADLFLDSISTFTTSELFPYNQCVFFAVVTSMVSLDRVALRQRVVESPEVLSVIGKIPHLATFLNSLFYCSYKEFFPAFVEIMDAVRRDPYLHPHLRYYMREIRVVAYSQFLESYKSVTLESMASAFNVSQDFLDSEVAEFIVAGRLNAKIDKVSGIIETNRPDAKNALYQDSIKKGDLLLNRIQKLSRVIDVE